MADEPRPAAPRVWRWYLAYCGLNALVYLVFGLAGLLVLTGGVEVDPHELQDARVGSGVILVLGIAFASAHLAAFLLPRRPWAWTYHLVLICIGMASLCCLPMTIPLIVSWMQPRTQAFFGRAP